MLPELEPKEVGGASIIGIMELIDVGSTNSLLEKCGPYD